MLLPLTLTTPESLRMFYGCNILHDVIFYTTEKSPRNLLDINVGNIFPGCSKKNSSVLPTWQALWLSRPSRPLSPFGVSLVSLPYRPQYLPSYQTTGVGGGSTEMTRISFSRTHIHNCGVKQTAERKGFSGEKLCIYFVSTLYLWPVRPRLD